MLNARIKSRETRTLQIELPALTGVRGLAAWWVVVYHFRENLPLDAWPIGGAVIARGYLAVDLFFVLSGFIIGLNYMTSFQPASIRSYLRFLLLRLGRIYPLHLFMLVVFLLNPVAIILLSQAGDPGARYAASYYAMSLLLVQNWGFSNDLAWNIPAWSISTEWFAYLMFPAIVWLGHLARNKSRALVGIALSLLLLSGATFALGDQIPENGLARCVLEFTAGTLVCILWRLPSTDRRYWAESATILWLPPFAAAFIFPIPDYPLAALAWCILIFGLANNRTMLSRILSLHLLCKIGEYSYSTYLVHYFIRDWMKFLVLGKGIDWRLETGLYLVATASASIVLYHAIEVPGRLHVRTLVGRSRLAPRPCPRIGGAV